MSISRDSRRGSACAFGYDAHATEFEKLGRIAVKIINHLGDEVMKVFKAN